MFEERQGKVGHRWSLWVFQSATAVCFVLGPSRSASVPAATLNYVDEGTLSVGRYASYRKFARLNPGGEDVDLLGTPAARLPAHRQGSSGAVGLGHGLVRHRIGRGDRKTLAPSLMLIEQVLAPGDQ